MHSAMALHQRDGLRRKGRNTEREGSSAPTPDTRRDGSSHGGRDLQRVGSSARRPSTKALRSGWFRVGWFQLRWSGWVGFSLDALVLV